MTAFSNLISSPARELARRFSALPPKQPATEAHLIKLDSNENPFGPSPLALQALQSALAASNFYPDDDCRALRQKLASLHAVPSEQILVTAGSTEMLALLSHTLLSPGLNAVTSERSFIVYGMAVLATGGQLIEVPMGKDDGFDLSGILAAIDGSTRLVFIANPNNPTGTMLPAPVIDNFLARLPEHVVAVLDEAYYDYAQSFAAQRRIEYPASLDYVRGNGRIIVLRTFSKAHGLAGLRVAYAVGPAELIAFCARMQNAYSVSTVAQVAAIAALDDRDHIARVVANNFSQAEIVRQELSNLQFRVIPTFANFLYCDVKEQASEFAARLRSEGVSVRPLGAWGAPTCIRVTIGTPQQNQVLLNAIRSVAESPR